MTTFHFLGEMLGGSGVLAVLEERDDVLVVVVVVVVVVTGGMEGTTMGLEGSDRLLELSPTTGLCFSIDEVRNVDPKRGPLKGLLDLKSYEDTVLLMLAVELKGVGTLPPPSNNLILSRSVGECVLCRNDTSGCQS